MRIVAEPLTAQAFKPFGTVLGGTPVPGRVYVSDGTAGDEELVPVTTPLTVVLP